MAVFLSRAPLTRSFGAAAALVTARLRPAVRTREGAQRRTVFQKEPRGGVVLARSSATAAASTARLSSLPREAGQAASGTAADDDDARAADAEALFYGERVSFANLGLRPDFCDRLRQLGLLQSTAVQAAAIPHLLSGGDMVVGAETGSGKTLAYLLPLLQRLIERRAAPPPEPPEELLGNAPTWDMFPEAVVLLPNRELCEQVLDVANSILDGIGAAAGGAEAKPVTAGMAFGGVAWPYGPGRPAPTLLVCTPQLLEGYGSLKNVPPFVKCSIVVLDEADMLLDGGYKRQLDGILTGFRRADRLSPEERPFKTQYVLVAATIPSFGLKSVERLIGEAFPGALVLQQGKMHYNHPAMRQEFVRVGDAQKDKLQALLELLRREGHGSSSAAAAAGNGPVTAPETDGGFAERTMVFVNTAETCQIAAETLRGAGVAAGEYHKELAPAERLHNLGAFRRGETTVLVCTDLAARGLDVPGISRIVQMDFALNVVQHLHRLGRAARAGQSGFATNFYDEGSSLLASAIEAAAVDDRPLSDSFSRQRGFRKKFKKYGPSRTAPQNRREG